MGSHYLWLPFLWLFSAAKVSAGHKEHLNGPPAAIEVEFDREFDGDYSGVAYFRTEVPEDDPTGHCIYFCE